MADDAPEQQDADGASAEELLLGAAKRDNADMALEALEAGATINTADGLGNTALHYFAQYGNDEGVAALVNREGLRVDAQNRQWDTPLHLAAANEHEEIVRVLIEKGAHPALRNKLRQLPVDVAGTPEIKQMIQSAVFARQLAGNDAVSDDEEEGDGDDDD